jgi:hypothetical protein
MVANNTILALNETLYNLNQLTGNSLISGVVVFFCILILLELIDLPIYGKIGVWGLASFAIMSLLGLPEVISGLILVLGGVMYFFIFRRIVE